MCVFDRFRLDGKRLFITGGSRGLLSPLGSQLARPVELNSEQIDVPP
jgi:hypothetical protein